MLIETSPTTIIKYGNLIAKVHHRKFGEYRYRSPRYGTKLAYHYTMDIYVYEKGREDEGWVARWPTKGQRRSDILQYLEAVQRTLAELRGPRDSSRLVHLHRAIGELGIKRR
jgi:hypothetical protein